MFVILVSAELYGSKHNIEVGFPSVPTMTELIGHLESTYQIENRLMRPVNHPKQAFRLEYIQVFDEVLQRWVDLLSSTQLHEWAQLYIFQPDTASRIDHQQQIPSTRPIRSLPAEAPTETEWVWQLFQDIDVNSNGYIERDELQRIFSVLGLFEFSEPQVDEFFVHADTNRDGVLSYAEFSKFNSHYPNVIDAIRRATEDYFQAVKIKDCEKAYLRLKYDEVEARYSYLQHRRDVLLLEARIQAQRDALLRAEEERIFSERNQELSRLRNDFIERFGQDPGSPTASPRSKGGFYSDAGYGSSRRYPRPVSSPRHQKRRSESPRHISRT